MQINGRAVINFVCVKDYTTPSVCYHLVLKIIECLQYTCLLAVKYMISFQQIKMTDRLLPGTIYANWQLPRFKPIMNLLHYNYVIDKNQLFNLNLNIQTYLLLPSCEGHHC